MEWLKNGYKKRSAAGGLIFGQCHLFNNKPHSAKSSIPTFHYSNTPWDSITAIRIRETDLTQMAWLPMLDLTVLNIVDLFP
jgi:hypothetical protein